MVKQKLQKKKPKLLTKIRVSNFLFRILNQFFEIYGDVSTENGLEKAHSGISNLDEVGVAQNVSIADSSCKFDVLKIITDNRVVVKYAEKKLNKKFIGHITGMEEEEFVVKGVRKSATGDYRFQIKMMM